MKLRGILQLSLFRGAGSLYLPILLLLILTACDSDGCRSPLNNRKHKKIDLPENGPITAAESALLKDSCEAWFSRTLEKTVFSGGMLVAKEGNIVFEIYRGEVALGSNLSFTDSTPVHIASVSKTFTAMAILRLWEDKKLNIDDPIADYIDNLPYSGITIRNLLTHRSGLPNYTSFMDASDWNREVYLKNKDLPGILTLLKDQLPPPGTPDRHFSYCNTNYALLALVIEKVSGKNYGDYLSETFFRPLGMHHSFVRTDTSQKNVVLSCDWRGGIISDNYLDLVYGDKNIYSTPRDLLTWEKALRSGVLFSPETLEQAYAPYSNEKPGMRNYGLGWRLIFYPDGNKLIYHNGWWHGNNAVFIRVPQKNAVIIVLGNRYTKSVYKARELISLFYGSELPEEDE